MDWPAYSPKLSPIKTVRHIMEYNRDFRSPEQLDIYVKQQLCDLQTLALCCPEKKHNNTRLNMPNVSYSRICCRHQIQNQDSFITDKNKNKLYVICFRFVKSFV